MLKYFLAILISVPPSLSHAGGNALLSRIHPVPATRQVQAMEEEILGYVNGHRADLGLSPLKMDAAESDLAVRHSRNMASGKTAFGHAGFNSRAKTIQKTGALSVAENVAEGQMNARQVVDGWLNSPGHKKNIEGNFTLTGIGYATDRKGNLYFTQIFSR